MFKRLLAALSSKKNKRQLDSLARTRYRRPRIYFDGLPICRQNALRASLPHPPDRS